MNEGKVDAAKKKNDKPAKSAASVAAQAGVTISGDEINGLVRVSLDLCGLRRLLRALSGAYQLTGSEAVVLSYACKDMADRLSVLVDALQERHFAAMKDSSKEEKK